MLGAELDARHVFRADDLRRDAVRAAVDGLDDDVAELLRLGQPTQRVHGHLEGAGRLRGLLAKLSRRGGLVLPLNGVGDFRGGDAARGEQLGIEPGANAVVAFAQVVDVGHSLQPEQLVLDVNRGEVAQIDVVVAAVGRVEADGQQDVRRFLLDRQPLLLDRVGQLRHGQRDAVLHHHQGGVQIRAEVKRDGQVVRAVIARLARHVQHAFDAVDLLLDRRGDGIGHDLGARAG